MSGNVCPNGADCISSPQQIPFFDDLLRIIDWTGAVVLSIYTELLNLLSIPLPF